MDIVDVFELVQKKKDTLNSLFFEVSDHSKPQSSPKDIPRSLYWLNIINDHINVIQQAFDKVKPEDVNTEEGSMYNIVSADIRKMVDKHKRLVNSITPTDYRKYRKDSNSDTPDSVQDQIELFNNKLRKAVWETQRHLEGKSTLSEAMNHYFEVKYLYSCLRTQKVEITKRQQSNLNWLQENLETISNGF